MKITMKIMMKIMMKIEDNHYIEINKDITFGITADEIYDIGHARYNVTARLTGESEQNGRQVIEYIRSKSDLRAMMIGENERSGNDFWEDPDYEFKNANSKYDY